MVLCAIFYPKYYSYQKDKEFQANYQACRVKNNCTDSNYCPCFGNPL